MSTEEHPGTHSPASPSSQENTGQGELDPNMLPGGSPETAIPITPEQADALVAAGRITRKLSLQPSYAKDPELLSAAEAIVPDPALVDAGVTLGEARDSRLGGRPSRQPSSLWVRTEEDPPRNRHRGVKNDYNTWEILVNEGRYGSSTGEEFYMTHPDGSVELAYKFQPYRY